MLVVSVGPSVPVDLPARLSCHHLSSGTDRARVLHLARAVHGKQGRPGSGACSSDTVHPVLTTCPLVLSSRCPRSPQAWMLEGGAVFVAL